MARNRRRSPFKALSEGERGNVRDRAMGIARRNQALNGLENARRALPGQISDSQKRGKTPEEVNRVTEQVSGKRLIQAGSFRDQAKAMNQQAEKSAKKIGQPGQGWEINQNRNSPRFGKRFKRSGEGGSVHTYAPLSFSKSHKFVVPPNAAKKSGGKYGSAASAVAGKMAKVQSNPAANLRNDPRARLPMNPRTQGWGQLGGIRGKNGGGILPRPGQAGRRTLPQPTGGPIMRNRRANFGAAVRRRRRSSSGLRGQR